MKTTTGTRQKLASLKVHGEPAAIYPMPATGTLVLALADGTAREVDLTQVMKASVNP